MSDWQEISLDKAGIIFEDGDRGKNYPSQNELLSQGDCIFLSTKNVRLTGFDFAELQWITLEKDNILRKGKLQRNDIVLTTRGTVGNSALYSDEVKYSDIRINSGMVILRSFNSQVLSKFLLYFLKQLDFKTYISGSAQPQLPIRDLKEININLPPLPEQKAIADVLSALDNKIDLLQRQNETLEKMAETLFRQWFIEGDAINNVPLHELIEFNPKYSLSKGKESTYLEMAGLSTSTFNAEGFYPRKFTSGMKFQNQDTLLARITPCLENGKVAYVHFLNQGEIGWGSTEYIVMQPKNNLHPLFAYVLARNPDFKEYAENCMEGSSGRQRVNLDHLKKFTINYPDNEKILQFNDLLNSIEPKLVYNAKQIQTLQNMRDTLLPKLMSGEVRVKLD